MEVLNLFEITVEVSFLILFIGIARRLFKNFINPNLRYFLWIFVALRILVPLHLQISVVLPQMPEDSTLYLGMEVNLENMPLGAVLQGEAPGTQPAAGNGAAGDSAKQEASLAQGTEAKSNTDGIPEIDTKPEGTQSDRKALSPKEVLMLIWLTGVILMAAYLLINNIRMFRKLRAGRKKIKKLTGGLTLYDMPGDNCLAGILFPAIYVDAEQFHNDSVIDNIIRHELQHYRVRDHYWQFIRVICLALQWHNPFVWWAYSASKQDCEMACDARVVRDMSSEERYKYGDSLLSVIEQASLKKQGISLTTSMGGSKKFLQERIKNIMQHKRRYAIVLSVIIICIIGVLGFITFRVQGEESEKGHFINNLNAVMGTMLEGKETLSAEEIEGLEPVYNIDISMEAIINGTDGYEEAHETLWGFIDSVQESSGLPYTGGFQYGERGCYISLTPIYFWDARANEIANEVWFAVFNEDFSETQVIQFFKVENTLMMQWSSAFGESLIEAFRTAPDEKYICMFNTHVCMLDAQNSLHATREQVTVEGDYYHALDYEKLGISYNDFAAPERLVWIDFTNLPSICEIPQEDIAVIPEVPEYSYQDAVFLGSAEELHGMLPGVAEGTWYTVQIDGIEYYYGRYDFEETKDPELYGWSIVSEDYSLANGLKVGMAEQAVMEQFPNMAVMNFDGPVEDKYIYSYVTGHQGWNGIAYPRSYIGMDDDWDYEDKNHFWEYREKDYYWTDQFDYIMIADIILEDKDTLTMYLGLLMKHNRVAAITFFYPTAG
ncbi:MAG: hypothetical protein J1E83_07965 [Lachnospiraceae bacterium]|nr:hypothetical protein [Lachnospiraceae bacterium]